MDSSFLLFAVCMLAIFSTRFTDGCSCMPSHPQDQFCRAEFVVKAKIKGSSLVYRKYLEYDAESGKNVTRRFPINRKYNVRINKVFKKNEKFQNISHTEIYSGVWGASCGVFLKNHTKYLLSGFIYNGKAHISLCDWVSEWKDVSPKQRKGLTTLYGQSCECKIQTCFSNVCKEKEDTCIWNWTKLSRCYAQSGICQRGKEGQCGWSNNKLLRRCIKAEKKARKQLP